MFSERVLSRTVGMAPFPVRDKLSQRQEYPNQEITCPFTPASDTPSRKVRARLALPKLWVSQVQSVNTLTFESVCILLEFDQAIKQRVHYLTDLIKAPIS